MNQTTNDQSTVVTWDVLLKLLNERFPLLVSVDDGDVRDRVAQAVSAGTALQEGGETRSLRIVTYRGRTFEFNDVANLTIVINKRDRQGIPVAYTVELGPAKHMLEFTA